MVAVQELIWRIRPDLVIETGIAHGGSLILSASMLALLDYCDAIEAGRTPRPETQCPAGPRNRYRHPQAQQGRDRSPSSPSPHLDDRGSSIDPEVVEQVRNIARPYKCVMVFLDSNHTHEHVLAELEAYAPLATSGSYCIVFDTIVEELPDELFPDRPWGRGDNPMTAVVEYLRRIQDRGARGAGWQPAAVRGRSPDREKAADDGGARRLPQAGLGLRRIAL
jgi:cephalosporin hydroxylase